MAAFHNVAISANILHHQRTLFASLQRGLRKIYPDIPMHTARRYQKHFNRNLSHLVLGISMYMGSGYGTGTSLVAAASRSNRVSLTGTGTSASRGCGLLVS